MEESFLKLVSFKYNYMNKTQKELEEIFKAIFENEDENNKIFLENTNMQDLCKCFETFFAMYPTAVLEEIGISKYITQNEQYILITTTVPSYNKINKIVGIDEEFGLLFHITEQEKNKNHVKSISDFSVINALNREENDAIDKRGMVTTKMLNKMRSNEENKHGEVVMTCKSKLRTLYSRLCNIKARKDIAVSKYFEQELSEETKKEVEELIYKSLKLEKSVEENVHWTVVKIKNEHDKTKSTPNYEMAERIEEEIEEITSIEPMQTTPEESKATTVNNNSSGNEEPKGENSSVPITEEQIQENRANWQIYIAGR